MFIWVRQGRSSRRLPLWSKVGTCICWSSPTARCTPPGSAGRQEAHTSAPQLRQFLEVFQTQRGSPQHRLGTLESLCCQSQLYAACRLIEPGWLRTRRGSRGCSECERFLLVLSVLDSKTGRALRKCCPRRQRSLCYSPAGRRSYHTDWWTSQGPGRRWECLWCGDYVSVLGARHLLRGRALGWVADGYRFQWRPAAQPISDQVAMNLLLWLLFSLSSNLSASLWICTGLLDRGKVLLDHRLLGRVD